MSDDEKNKKPPTRQDYIKGGGTASSGEDQKRAREQAEADRRRAYQDRLVSVSKAAYKPSTVEEAKSTAYFAKLFSRNIGGLSDHAVIVLKAENHDRTTLDYIICNLLVEEGDEGTERFKLVMVCPSCLHRHRRSVAQSHITLRSEHRCFTLHDRHRGSLWVNPREPSEAYHLAGSIDTHEVQTCPTCAFRFEIGPAKLDGGEAPVSGAVRPV